MLKPFPVLFLSLLFTLTTLLTTTANAQQNPSESFYSSDFRYREIGKGPADALSDIEQLIQQKQFDKLEHYYLVHNLGYTHFRLNNKDKAISTLTKSIEIAESLDIFYQAKSLHRRAMTYGILFRDSDTALSDLKQALNLITQTKHKYSKALHFDLLTSLSQAYNQKADIKTAKVYVNKALKLVQHPNDKEDKIYALVILGRLYWQENNIDAATQAYLSALKLTDQDTSKGRIASIELRLAKVYYANHVLDKSLLHANNAVKTFTDIKNKRSLINSIKLLGDIQLKLAQNINKAIMHYLNALDIAFEIDGKHAIGELEHLIGAAYIKENNLKQAAKYLNAAQISLDNSQEKYYSALNFIELAKLSHAQSNTAHSVELLEQLIGEERLNSYPKALYEAKSHLIKYYTFTGNDKDAVKVLQQQLEYLQHQLESKENDTVGQLNTNIELSSLKSKVTKLTEQNEEQQTFVKTISQHRQILSFFIIALLIVLVSLVYWLFVMFHHVKKNKHNTELKWTQFLAKITQFQYNTRTSKLPNNSQHGILVSIPSSNLQSSDPARRYQANLALDNWQKAFTAIFETPACAKRYSEIWSLLPNMPQNSQYDELIVSANQNMIEQQLIWLSLADLPEKISHDTLEFIEQLIYQVADSLSGAKAGTNLTEITMQESVLDIVFKNNEGLELGHNIKHALDTGIIRLQTKSLK